MITLAIETSCDETAICILETEGTTKYRILSNLIHSQIDLHRQYGGVFPIMAKREHARNIMPLIEEAFREASINLKQGEATQHSKVKIEDILTAKEPELLAALTASPLYKQIPTNIDRIAVTTGPGLEPALWVGVNLARALSVLWNIPVIGVNHMEGHIFGSLLSTSATATKPITTESPYDNIIEPDLPALALLISGGHTELVLVNAENTYTVIGRTKDDAIGEAFDKTARMLGLPYPGGPEISRLAVLGRERHSDGITLPRPMIHSKDLDFSFSGLKTAVLYLIRELTKNSSIELTDTQREAIACEFENAVTDVLIAKTTKAIETHSIRSLIVGGGVIANKHITKALTKLAEHYSIPLYTPPAGVSGDNALMIGITSVLSDKAIVLDINDSLSHRANGNLSL